MRRQDRGKGLRGNPPCRHRGLGLPASGTVRRKVSDVYATPSVVLLWQPEHINTGVKTEAHRKTAVDCAPGSSHSSLYPIGIMNNIAVVVVIDVR